MRRSNKKKVEILSPLKASNNPKFSRRKPKKHEYSFEVGQHLKQMVGTDLTTMPGIDASTALKLISEIGTDISRWPTAKHFCAWLGLCPGTRISGGKYLNSHTSHSTNRAAVALRMAASSLYRSNTTLGAHLRRMKARMGPVQATTATAHKMARSIYYMMQRQTDYIESGGDYYDKLNREKTIKYMRKRAESLGYKLEKKVS